MTCSDFLPARSRNRSGRPGVQEDLVTPVRRSFQEDIMMHRNLLATILVAGTLSAMAGRSDAAPLSASMSLRDAMPQQYVETVQWRGRGGWGGRGWGGGFGGIGLGLAAG